MKFGLEGKVAIDVLTGVEAKTWQKARALIEKMFPHDADEPTKAFRAMLEAAVTN